MAPKKNPTAKPVTMLSEQLEAAQGAALLAEAMTSFRTPRATDCEHSSLPREERKAREESMLDAAEFAAK